jgi:hypothetical protein
VHHAMQMEGTRGDPAIVNTVAALTTRFVHDVT